MAHTIHVQTVPSVILPLPCPGCHCVLSQIHWTFLQGRSSYEETVSHKYSILNVQIWFMYIHTLYIHMSKPGGMVMCIAVYSGTSLLWPPLGLHEESWLKRCCYFRGYSVHFMKLGQQAVCWLELYVSLLQRSLIERLHSSTRTHV